MNLFWSSLNDLNTLAFFRLSVTGFFFLYGIYRRLVLLLDMISDLKRPEHSKESCWPRAYVSDLSAIQTSYKILTKWSRNKHKCLSRWHFQHPGTLGHFKWEKVRPTCLCMYLVPSFLVYNTTTRFVSPECCPFESVSGAAHTQINFQSGSRVDNIAWDWFP